MNTTVVSMLRRLGALAALACLAAGPAQAQDGADALRFAERYPVIGVRLMGMGGAGAAGLADQSALFNNPAGLGYYRRSEFSGSLNALNVAEEARYETGGAADLVENDVSRTGLGHAAYVFKVPTAQGSLVFGAAYNRVNGFDRNLVFEGVNDNSSIAFTYLPFDDEYRIVEEDGEEVLDITGDVPYAAYQAGLIDFSFSRYDEGQYPFFAAIAPGTAIDQRGDVLEEGRMDELNFGGAVEAAAGTMLGLSVNFVFGTYRFDRLFEENDSRDENTGARYAIVVNNRTYSGFDRFVLNDRFEADLTGLNLRAGLSTAAVAGLRLGLTVESPTFYNVREEYETVLETFFDSGGSLRYGDQPGDVGRGTFEYEIRTPWRFGGGLAFETGPALLAFDAEYVDWSQTELTAPSDRSYFAGVNRDIREALAGVVNVRAGLEYRLGALALRGGFAYQPDPRSEERLGSREQPERSRRYLSAGLGYQLNDQLALDLGWMQQRFDDRYQPYSDPDIDTPPVVEETVIRNRFGLGLRFAF